jgi:hypothetical protein
MFLMDSTSDFPIQVRGLIDDGSHLVLITPELVDRLKLCRHLLHVPETVDVAMTDSSTSERTLAEYVHLRCTSIDSRWTSNTVCALIAPGLCAPVILGLPWLTRNHVVIDHHESTVIDKRVNYTASMVRALQKTMLMGTSIGRSESGSFVAVWLAGAVGSLFE